jgi:hypothetical protein
MILVLIGVFLLVVSIIIALLGLVDCYDFKLGLDKKMMKIGMIIGISGLVVACVGSVVYAIQVTQ